MNNKDLMTQGNDSDNRIVGQDLSTEMVELSEEVLFEVRGGVIDLNLSNPRPDWKLPVIQDPRLKIPCDPKVIVMSFPGAWK
jgi:hypothetical protein